MTTGEADLLTSILQGRRHAGNGQARRARRTGPTAGKTGTTDNYGDAWFVGYTPQLAVAVWVGYPDKLQPMLTEFGGKPVAGGTLPAQIWHAFMTAADKQLKQRPGAVPADAVHPGAGQADRLARRLVQARQRLLPRNARRRVLRRPRPVDARRSATRTRSRCPSSSARRSTRPTRLLAQQPLGSELIGVPTKAGQASGLRRQAGAAQRVPLGQRHRAALRHPARPALRAAAESRRVERHGGARAAEDAEGTHDDHLRQGRRRDRCSSRRRSPGSPPARASR